MALFGVEMWEPGETLAPDWNVAPTKQVHAVLERPVKSTGDPRPVRQLRCLTWGLVPSWAQSPDMGAKMINARAETVHEKPAFRRPFAARRCLLPADGYYEWGLPGERLPAQQTAPARGGDAAGGRLQLEPAAPKKRPRKQPYFVTPVDGSVMAMAGLYEFWRDRTLPDDHPRAWWATCTVVTTEADRTPLPGRAGGAGGPESLADIHPRMPLMLPPERWDAWLDPERRAQDELRALLQPPPAGGMRAYPVSTDVGNVRNNGPELVREWAGEEVRTLF